ncbi:MAG: ABC transporter permease [Elusimicrobiota bacterium]
MRKYIIKRIILFVPLLIGITLITFVIMHLTPGSPVDRVKMNPNVDTRAQLRLYKAYGLDKPIHIQYWNWLKRVVTLNFGTSFKDGRKVINKILERLPATLLLNIASLIFIFGIALPVGIISAVKHNTFIDRSLMVMVFIGYSVPTFALALLFMYFFGVHLGWLPVSGMVSINFEFLTPEKQILDILRHLILPVVTLGITGLAFISRYLRSSMLEVIRQEYIKAARARGIKNKNIILVHALKNALIPIVTMIGLLVPSLIGGSVVFETIFSWPGMGRLAYNAIMSRDYPVVMGVGIIMAVMTLLGNLLADIGYGYVDPRVRYQK